MHRYKSLFVSSIFLALVLMTSACQSNKDNVKIMLFAHSNTVSAEYKFSKITNTINFSINNNVDRENFVSSQGRFNNSKDQYVLEINDDTVKFAISPNVKPLDRVFPTLTEFDDGVFVLNLDPILLREHQVIQIRNYIDLENHSCVSEKTITHNQFRDFDRAKGRYILIADSMQTCQSFITSSASTTYVSAGIPNSITHLLSELSRRYFAQFTNLLEVEVEKEFIIVAVNIPDQKTKKRVQADVGWNSFIFLRYYGVNWDEEDFSKDKLKRLLSHEISHVWLGKHFKLENELKYDAQWLIEGGAEYFSLKLLAQNHEINRQEFRDSLEQHIRSCFRNYRGGALLTKKSPRQGKQIYDCGVVVQFIYDAYLQHQSGGTEDIFAYWSKYFQQLETTQNMLIAPEAFLKRSEVPFQSLSSLFYEETVNYDSLVSFLNLQGFKVTKHKVSDKEAITEAILFAILHKACPGGSIGYYTNNNKHTFATNDSCFFLSNSAPVVEIQQLKLEEQPYRVYLELVKTCEKPEGVLKIRYEDDTVMASLIPCGGTKLNELFDIKLEEWPEYF